MADDTLKSLSSGEVAQAFVDHMGGSAYIKDYPEANESWTSFLSLFTQYLERNVNYYLNAGTVETEEMQKRKTISQDGFPTYMKVNYTYVSPGGYTPWSSIEDREVKQVVLHSFGHQWHAFQSDGKWFGILNTPNQRYRYIYDEETIRIIPRGTNIDRGMEHKGRLAGALSACMFPTPGNAGAHFIISRSGDLYVMADCNDVLNSSHDLSPTAISIALEEALYLEVKAGESQPEATWLPGGTPPGTDGTLGYWDFSSQQYLTLAILLKKLQVAYPALSTRVHTSSRGEGNTSFTGYTMHSHVQGADSRYTDVSPHLQSDEDWNLLFDLVDKQEQIDQTNVWRPLLQGYEGRLSWVEDLGNALQNLGSTGLTKKMMTSPALVSLMGTIRAYREFQNDTESYRQKAATAAALSSSAKKVQAGMETVVDQGLKAPLSLPTKEDTAEPSECEWDL